MEWRLVMERAETKVCVGPRARKKGKYRSSKGAGWLRGGGGVQDKEAATLAGGGGGGGCWQAVRCGVARLLLLGPIGRPEERD